MKQGEGRGRLSAGESETGAVSRSMPTGRCGVPVFRCGSWWVKGCVEAVEYPGIRKGGPSQRGRHLAMGAHCRGGGMSEYFFRMRCWQPLPVESHFLHNEVAQVGIEEEINGEAV